MGGMSAQIPIKDDPKANEVAMAKVRADKLREVTAGHDGTWIAHPLINKIAMEIFNEHMLGPNQVSYFQCPKPQMLTYLLRLVLQPSCRSQSCRCRPPQFIHPHRESHRSRCPRERRDMSRLHRGLGRRERVYPT